MYLSKYYTCEEIDQRLLQGYYDDFVKAGFGGTIQEFWAFVLSISNKVDKKDGYGLSKNDFTDELLEKLNGIEEHANYITKVSQLENDMAYQTEDQVRQAISNLVDGADDALDTLKELAEALGNDPNFATTITNKLTELRTELQEEIDRAIKAETDLANQIAQLNSDLVAKFKEFLAKLEEALQALGARIDNLTTKVDEDIANLAAYKTEMATTVANARAEAKAYTDAETNRAKEAEQALAQADHDLLVKHTQDISSLNASLQAETAAREKADQNITNSLVEEQQARIQEDANIRSEFAAADQEIKDNYVPWDNIPTTELPNRRAITLKNLGDIILAKGTDGRTYSMVQLNRWGVADFGNSSYPFNINTPAGVRPTVQEAGQTGEEAHHLAYLEDVQKWFGKIDIPAQYQDASVVQLIPALEQSYVDDLGNPDTINGEPFNATSNTYKIGDPYLSIAYFDEAFVMHYHLYSANNSYNVGAVFYAMMDYAKKNQEDHDAIRQEIKDSQTSTDNIKDELLAAIQEEATTRQEADQALDDKKVDKKEGYDLSKNDFTDELLEKLNGIEEGANKITALSQLLNDMDFQNSTQVNEAIEKVIGSAPEVLDTLEEIAKALGDDPNFAATITKKLAAITEDLNEEVDRATAAEQALQTNIDNLGTQTDTKLLQLSNQFQQKLDTEATTRQEADQALQKGLTNEATERQASVNQLTQALTQEYSDRQSADQNLQTQITQLANNMAAQGTSLIEYVNGIRDTLQKGITDNTTLINQNAANIQRNLELIQGLQGQMDTLNTSITDLTLALNKEIQDRKDADQVLQDQVDQFEADLAQETAQREAQDNILQSNIDKEIQDRKDAIAALEKAQGQALAQEIQDRKDADKAIQDQIDTFPDNIRVNEQPQTDASVFKIVHTYKYKDAQKKYTGENQNIITIPAATSTEAGVMTAEDKNKLEKVVVDLETETNNRVAQDNILQGNIDTLSKKHQDDVDALKQLIKDEDSDDVEWQDVADQNLPNRKAIILPTMGDIILVTGPDGTTHSAVQLNRWGVMDFGNPTFPINLNTPAGVRPTVQEAGQTGEQANKIAYVSDVEQLQNTVQSQEQRIQQLENLVAELYAALTLK